MMIRSTALLCLLASTTSAFSVVAPHSLTSSRFATTTTAAPAPSVVLFAKKDKKGFSKDADAEEPDAAVVAEEEPTDEEAAAAAEVVVELTDEEKEAAEVAAIKEEIKNMESELKAKKNTLNRIEEDVEKYTKSGYARRVAQMEDMRRVRATMQSSNKETSKAAVIQNFLPILDELREMQTENPDTVYAGLAGAMGSALKELGVEEFSSQAGDVVNPQKVAVLEEEYSADVPKGNIVRPVSMGFDLAGNVMRLGQVVVSLGAEEEEQAAAATPQEEESSDDAAVAE